MPARDSNKVTVGEHGSSGGHHAVFIALETVTGGLLLTVSMLLCMLFQRFKSKWSRSEPQSARPHGAEDPMNVVVVSLTMNSVEVNEQQQARLQSVFRPTGRNETVGVPLINTVRPIDVAHSSFAGPAAQQRGVMGAPAAAPLANGAKMSAVIVDRNGTRIPCALPRMTTSELEMHFMERKASCDVYERFFATHYDQRAASEAVVPYLSPTTSHAGTSFTIAISTPRLASMASMIAMSPVTPGPPMAIPPARSHHVDPLSQIPTDSRSDTREKTVTQTNTTHEPSEYVTHCGHEETSRDNNNNDNNNSSSSCCCGSDITLQPSDPDGSCHDVTAQPTPKV